MAEGGLGKTLCAYGPIDSGNFEYIIAATDCGVIVVMCVIWSIHVMATMSSPKTFTPNQYDTLGTMFGDEEADEGNNEDENGDIVETGD